MSKLIPSMAVLGFALVSAVSAPSLAGIPRCENLFANEKMEKVAFLSPAPTISEDLKVGVRLANPEHPMGPIVNALAKALNLPLQTGRLTEVVRRLEADSRDVNFWVKLADAAEVRIEAAKGMLEKIPAQGPLIIAMNHPLYGWEGVAFLAKLAEIRPDAKILMNNLLEALPGVQDHAFLMSVYTKENVRDLRGRIVSHLQEGKALLIFPAGALSLKESLFNSHSSDPEWQSGVMYFASQVQGTQILPVAVDGEPGLGFQLSKKVSDGFAMPFIFRGIAKNTKQAIPVAIGEPINSETLAQLSRAEGLQYLRARVEAMRDMSEEAKPRKLEPIPKPGSYAPVSAELFHSGKARTILDTHPEDAAKGFVVVQAYGRDIPQTLREIGRQRNLAFRPIGEGSQKGIDTDSFDQHYVQLILVDKAARLEAEAALTSGHAKELDDSKPVIVGGYRIGKVDEIVSTIGAKGVYTTEFFQYDSLLKGTLKQALELGRSFIQENHRGGRTLLVLWRGIMRFIINEAKENGRDYTRLIGPVSMSGAYKDNTKLIVTESRRRTRASELAPQVQAKTPAVFKTQLTEKQIELLLKVAKDEKVMKSLIKDLEQKPEAELPPLFGLYDSLNAKDLGVNLDRDFNSVDWLMLVNLRDAPAKQLKFYLGKDLYDEFVEVFGVQPN